MEAGQILFWVIIGVCVIGIVATIIDALWRGRKGTNH